MEKGDQTHLRGQRRRDNEVDGPAPAAASKKIDEGRRDEEPNTELKGEEE